MMSIPTSKLPARWLLLTGLISIGIASGFEVRAMFLIPQNWPRLLSTMGTITVGLYVLLLALGLTALLLGWFWPDVLPRLAGSLERLSLLRWLLVALGVLAIVWFYLYSPWQGIWPGPWTQFIFALGAASGIAWLAGPPAQLWTRGRELALAFGLFLYPRMILELRAWYSQAIVYRGATLLDYLLALGLAWWLFTPAGEMLGQKLITARRRLARARWVIVAILIAGPLLYLALAGAKFYIVNPAIRFALLLVEAYLIAFLISDDEAVGLSLKGIVVSAFALALVSALTSALLLVLDYPFSLSWSEGNRFYDYSLMFGQSLYQHSGPIVNPYGSPGRYFLWGILFLWQGLPIWVHRLWNVIVYTLPPLLVGWLAARKVGDAFLRAGLALFIALLFTVESPLHPPFLLAAAVALVFLYDESLWRRGLALAIASLYVGTSRWTWIPVTAAWGVLADLILYYPSRQGSFLKRLQPTIILAALGLLPGLVSGYSGLPLSSSAREYHQPLLWYRLLPNPTFPLGVLLSTVLISGPAICLLIWWVVSRRWKLDWLQQLALGGTLLGFLAAGLVVSTKIGGGADLHNLDMYLMTLALVLALGLYSMSRTSRVDFLTWPAWAQLLVAFMIVFPLYEFTPFFSGAAASTRLELAKPQEVDGAIRAIEGGIARSGLQGEVLFMDQRQLITFGYIKGVPFVPDYEKKYMMDQAMAGNADYFHAYYQDLANRRFRLIVTEILHTRKESTADFSEENNVWVKWVSEPTLCFYEPAVIDKDVNIELLVPRANPTGCDIYLSGE